jgi:hypothetical protein
MFKNFAHFGKFVNFKLTEKNKSLSINMLRIKEYVGSLH